MPRPEKSAVARKAEKLLRDAITAETAALQEEVAAANREIDRLCGLLSQVVRIASGDAKAAPVTAALGTVTPIGPTPEEIIAQREVVIPEGTDGDLDGADNMGPGRWL